MTDNITHTRICVEKPLKNETHVMQHLSNKSNSRQHLDKLRSAHLSQKFWNKDDIIKISFVAPPHNIKSVEWTPIDLLKKQGAIDPLEEEIRLLSPVEAVKKVIRDRIQPLVGLKFIFVSRGGMVRISFNHNRGSYSLIGKDLLVDVTSSLPKTPYALSGFIDK